ncbi:MAG TPA: ABC transporter ATP-binding protein [Actinomycetota bacterium]|nr:ABC transporter ATP-binding protein [Actinomycetota bacterium]
MAGVGDLLVEDVTVGFGETIALADASLEVSAGEFVSIVGPSGCGKSTLFNVISGLISPSSGRVLLDGEDVTGSTGHVGYMLQKDLLVPWRTVLGNIVLGAALTRGVTATDRQDALDLAARYGLGDFVHHYPHTLSGGMRQRVALMRTLAVHRDVLLLDEPFGALDSQTRLEMQRWLLEVWSELGRTVLFVTHDVDEAVFLADRVVVMTPRPGKIETEIPVPIPRPRRLETLTSSEFIDRKRRVLGLLYGAAV